MGKDPAVLFYTTDFLANTYHLTDKQVGMFVRLLCMQHIHGRICPDDMPDSSDRESKRVIDMFLCDEGGYYNKQMEEEIQKRQSFCKSRQVNRTKSVSKKKDDLAQEAEQEIVEEAVQEALEEAEQEIVQEAVQEAMQETVKAPELDIDSTAEKSTPKPKKQLSSAQKEMELRAEFERFWKAYPKKVAKSYCERIFLKMKPTPELCKRIFEAVEKQKKGDAWRKDGGKYIPNPSTWLNQERWLDDFGEISLERNKNIKRMGVYI